MIHPFYFMLITILIIMSIIIFIIVPSVIWLLDRLGVEVVDKKQKGGKT